MQYEHKSIEAKWQGKWKAEGTYRVTNDTARPKYYVLDMFPYPSGAGLHVGHPLGYIASDIVARYKRHSGFNVLHPMGYDSFGLPAEQYAIQTGQHPAKTTEINLARYREQLDRIGFSFDWSREVRTSDPAYYKWTQWIFLQLFDSWYDATADKARPISELIARFEAQGCTGQDASVLTGDVEEFMGEFSAEEWRTFDERTKQLILQHFRLAYLSDAWVNWCPALGTVLANDEVKDGVSERGGHPVERKRMKQWSLRITAYAQRLLDGLDTLDWSESIKEAQRNWIGRSEGALVRFAVKNMDLTPGPSPVERGGGASEHRFRETTDGFLWSKLIEHAKSMRRNPTEAEDRLWHVIRGTATGGRIRRQHIIDKFIVDFVSLPKQLVIEVDSDIHDLQQEQDAARTLHLEQKGFKVIRFRNEEVLRDAEGVRHKIIQELNARPDFATDDDTSEDGISPLSPGEVPGEHSSPLPGRGVGGEVEVFTTRPDTLFGVSFLTLAPEHELVPLLTTPERKAEVEAYVNSAKNRSERERQAEVDKVSGVFTGSYAKHPFTGADVPVWVGDYVLAGYGTGAVMAVPGGDQRDWRFAKHFGLPIIAVTEGADIEKEADERKDATICSEGFLKGLKVPQAITRAIQELEKLGAGEGKINFRLRDAAFGRQRYWGEPIPIYYKDGVPYPLPESELPLKLPEVDKFLPTEDGEPPLARAANWSYNGNPLETTTMPGWAGSSWYFLRYMDPQNAERFASAEALNYWQQVDLYVGGSEHATGHLLYFRFWTKFLHDRGHITFDEPAKKLVNQGMIQGVSQRVTVGYVDLDHQVRQQRVGLRIPTETGEFQLFNSEEYLKYSDDGTPVTQSVIMSPRSEILKDFDSINMVNFQEVNVPIEHVADGVLDVSGYRDSLEGRKHADAVFIADGGFVWRDVSKCLSPNRTQSIRTEPVVEKMSKSKFNVVNPDDIIAKYGADTLRLYEMFLGPLEQSKPWDTNGIEGTYRFLRKFWNLFHQEGATPGQARSDNAVVVSEEAPTKPELKVLHATLKKVTEDIEKMSFNTSVAQFMIAANELGSLKCNKRAVLEPLVVALAPFAPHIAEELWEKLGHAESVTVAPWPQWDAQHLVEDNFSYPISFNGKTRLMLEFPIALSKEEVEAQVLANPEVQAKLEGKAPKKVIVVPKRIVNIVV
ncbi:MAG: class I tRNA ligase family protein [Flavobacteriales bacterium]|nr:class I tRNA ligase family protein [Flavobacteriales bacterium]